MSAMSDAEQQLVARSFAFSMVQTFAAGLLVECADYWLQKGTNPQALIVANRWCAKNLTQLTTPSQVHQFGSRILALDL
jgi:hypothetical protein